MHIRDLHRIRPMLDFKTASTIATYIIHAKLDYWLLQFSFREQRHRPNEPPPSYTRNALAHAVTKPIQSPNTTACITTVLKTLHWLKEPERTEYKVIWRTHSRFNLPAFLYLGLLLTMNHALRSTRSSSTLALPLPSVTSSHSMVKVIKEQVVGLICPMSNAHVLDHSQSKLIYCPFIGAPTPGQAYNVTKV